MIGLGLLSRFNIIYDFYGKRLIIEPNKSFAQLFEFDMTGLTLRKNTDKNFIVKTVYDNSPAKSTGIIEGDIILEFNGERITADNSLAKIIQKYMARDKITLKVLRGEEELMLDVTLGEREE